jgi:hypothetical protein
LKHCHEQSYNESSFTQIANYEHDTAEIAEIKNEINDDLFKNVKKINESLMIWKWLYTTCTQIEQSVIYTELHFTTIFFTIKVLKHEKSINTCFNEIISLIKRIRAAVLLNEMCEWHSLNNTAWKSIEEVWCQKESFSESERNNNNRCSTDFDFQKYELKLTEKLILNLIIFLLYKNSENQ